MRILCIDVGTGTQDILVFDSGRPVENSVKLVLPSATAIAERRIRRATAKGESVLLRGVNSGGGPSHWALEDHLRAGFRAFATPAAAETFDDDPARIAAMGIEVVSEDEAARIEGMEIVLRDIDLDAIRRLLADFEESTQFDGVAVGCLDHGAAPPGVSDRLFRFDHIRAVVERRDDLLAFAYRPDDLPYYLTRARAAVASADGDAPVAFMDTGPAAALGALHDPQTAAGQESLVLNLGNMHLLGFLLEGRTIRSLFEHHTGEVTDGQIEDFTRKLADGTLTTGEVFDSKGHGALHLAGPRDPGRVPPVTVTGPLRGRLRGSSLDPHFAAPFGDMMLSGCFGLLRAFGEVYPWAADEIAARLDAD